MPIAACGLFLDNEAVQVAIGLRLGLDLCSPHVCHCGGEVDPEGHHSFTCRKSQGRSQRHFAINDILWRALTKEPLGLFRADGKRPDGATIVPWSQGRYLAWDATIVHTCATSYITSETLKYGEIPSSFIFQPVAIESLGQFNRSALEFIGEIGNRISLITGNKRETSFLFQKLSVCIQRFNLVAFKGTFTTTDDEA